MKDLEFVKMLEKVGKVTLRGGIFGNATWAVIVICLCITFITLAARNLYLDAVAIFFIIAFGSYFLRRLLQFAEKNPLIAILDGSEFVAHERIVHAAKNRGVLPLQSNEIDHVQSVIDNALIDADDIQETPQVEGQ